MTLSLEDHKDPLSLSMEEEDLMIAECNDAADHAEVLLDSIERTVQVTEGMDDLAAVAENIEVLTPEHLDLMNVASQMAVAGTDDLPETIIPAMEAYLGKKISVESIRDQAKAIWEHIRAFVKQVWAAITEFFDKMFGQTSRLTRSLDNFEERRKNIKGLDPIAAEHTLEIHASNYALCIDGSPVKNAMDLVQGLDMLEGVIDFSTVKYPAAIIKTAGGIKASFDEAAGLITRWNTTDSDKKASHEGIVEMFGERILKDLETTFSHLPNLDTVQIEAGFKNEISKPYLGNFRLVGKIWDNTAAGGDHDGKITGYASLERLRMSGITVDTHTVVQDSNLISRTIEVFDQKEIEVLVKISRQVVKLIENYRQRGGLKKLTQLAQEMVHSSDKMDQAFRQQQDPQTNDEQNYRALLNFNTSVARWAKEPTVGTIKSAIRTMQSVNVLIDKSLKHHGV